MYQPGWQDLHPLPSLLYATPGDDLLADYFAAERTRVHLHDTDPKVARFATKTSSVLGTPDNLTLH